MSDEHEATGGDGDMGGSSGAAGGESEHLNLKVC